MTGKVTSVPATYNDHYRNFYLADADSSLQVWEFYLEEGVALPAPNDTVVVCGYIKKFNTTYEFDTGNSTNVYVKSNTRGTSDIVFNIQNDTEENATATVTALDGTAIPENTTNGTTISLKVTPVSGREVTTVKVNGTKVDAQKVDPDNDESEVYYQFVVAGNMTVTVETKVVGTDGPLDASVTIQDMKKTDDNPDGWSNGETHNTLKLDDNITVTVTPGKAGSNADAKYYDSGYEWRIYQNGASDTATDNQPTITVAAKEGYKIVSVTVTYTAGNSGTLVSKSNTAVVYSSGDVIAVNDSSIEFTVRNNATGTKTNGQVKITKIEVSYVVDTPAEGGEA